MSRIKSLIRNTVVIALGNICTKFISFFLLPLYTSLLSTEEYGTVDLFSTYISLLLPLATLMIEQGAFRYLITKEENGITEETIVSSSFFIICILNTAFVLFGILFFQFYQNDYKYYLIPILVSASIFHWCLQLARGFKRLTLYSVGSVVSAFFQILLNVLFITVLHMGAKGMLIATVFGNCFGAFFIFFNLRAYKYIHIKSFDMDISKKMLSYSLPLIPNTLSLWIINSSDRTIVNYFLGTSSNGILAVSHKFPTIIQTFYTIFQLSWHELGTVHWNDPDRDSFFAKMIDSIVRVFSSICIVIIAIMPFAFNLFVRNIDYASAYMTIPIYIIAVLINIVIGLMGVVYVATKKTTEIAKTTIFAGVINIILHFALIKSIGLYAAAVSTFIAYVCALVFRVRDVNKYIRLKFNIKNIAVIIVSVIILMICYYSQITMIYIVGVILSVLVACYLCRDMLHYIVGYFFKLISVRREKESE